MRIGISAPHRASTPWSGVGRYVQGLVRGLLQVDERNEYVLLTREPYLESLPAHARWEILPAGGRWRRLRWDHFGIRRAVERLKIDALLATKTVLPRSMPCRAAATVHDLAFVRYPREYPWAFRVYWNRVMRSLAESPHSLVCVSRTTRDDVVDLFHPDPARVHAVPSGIEHGRFQPRPAEEVRRALGALGVAAPYFLFAGNLIPRKNVEGLLQAFAQLRRDEPGAALVLAGANLMGARFGPGVVHVPGVDDATLCALYSGAVALAFPTFYEGFGFPILEAMACGCPVITSNRGAMREIAEEAAQFVDPDSCEEIVEAMRRLLRDEGSRGELRERGFGRVRQFSWETTARATLAVLTYNARG